MAIRKITFTIVLLAAFVIGLVVVGGGGGGGGSNQTATATPLVIGDVSVRVPPTLLRVDPGTPISPLMPGEGDTLAVFRSTVGRETGTDAPVDGCSIYIGVEDNSNRLSLSEWLRTNSYRRPEDVDEEIQVGGITGLRRTGRGEIFDDPFITVFVPHDSVIHTLTLETHGDNPIIEQCRQDLNQMLSSFRVGR